MSLVNVSVALRHPRLSQAFQIRRMTGAYAASSEGVYTETPSVLNRRGVIQPTSQQDRVAYLPEGVRQDDAITVFSTEDILMADAVSQPSDIVLWQGRTYRVAFSKRYDQHGYWFSIAVGFNE